ncbi:hypothetical protein GCM10009113_04020 [Marinobacter szutsaonensis]
MGTLDPNFFSSQKGLISVIMPCYNYGRFLHDSITSVINQSYKNWELIIVDDGSEDDSLEIAKSFTDSRIKVFTQPNKGVSAARNLGLQHAEGEFIAFIDADDLWEIKKLELQHQSLLLDRECSISFCNFGRFSNNNTQSFGYFSDFFRNRKAKISKKTIFHYYKGNTFQELTKTSEMPWYPTAVMIRSSIIKNHIFNETLSIGEDIAFFLPLWISFEAVYVVLPLARLRVHDSNASHYAGSHNKLLYKLFSSITLESLPASKIKHVESKRIDFLMLIGYGYKIKGEYIKSMAYYKKALSLHNGPKPLYNYVVSCIKNNMKNLKIKT